MELAILARLWCAREFNFESLLDQKIHTENHLY